MATVTTTDPAEFTTLQKKLAPTRFPGMSGKMAAMVDCILKFPIEIVSPRLSGLLITSDGCLLGMAEGDCGYNEFFGSGHDLEQNWQRLLDVAGLTPEEREQAQSLFAQHVHRGVG